MIQNFRELFTHLRANKRLLHYTTYVVWRYRRVIAYVWLVVALLYSVGLGLANARDDREALATAARKAVLVGCRADRSNAIALRAALDGQIRFVVAANEPPPPTTDQRVDSIRQLKAKIKIPNCAKRVHLIDDADE